MKRNVPKLRFKGFSDEWKEIKLGEFLTFYSTNSFSRDCLNYEKGDVQNIHYGDIHMKFPTILDTEKYSIPYINSDINITKYSEESYCKDGDLVIADASEDYADIGKGIEVCNIGNKKILAGLHTILARDNKQKTVNGFKGYMMQSESVRKQVKVLAAGAKVLGISKSNLEKVNVKLPTLQEQERIANFLTKVDKIIEKQEEKVKNLENYKKGMMQKIFSQEIRFKDENGKEYPEWEYKRFGDITKKTGERNKENKEYKVYSISNKYGFIPQEEQFEESRLDSLDKSAYKIVYAGDFAYNPARINVGSIGLLDSGEGIVSSLYVCFRLTEEMNNEFYKNYFSTFTFNKDVIRSVEGGVREYLFYDNFIRIKAPVPCFREQNKIAEFLDIISKTLNKEAEKLNELKKWKKGLLQQMFV